MTAAIRSALTGGVALAGAAVVAMSPVSPAPQLSLPRSTSAAIQLVDLPTPAFGALPYQALVNGLTSVIALAPIVFGSTEQCTVCLGPAGGPGAAPPLPFSGWGAVGILTGLLTSPVAFVQTLIDTSNLGQAAGVAGLAIQTPITNTLALLSAPRQPVGGFELIGTLSRTAVTLRATIDGLLAVTSQALITGPLVVLTGIVKGAQLFTATLAQTGNLVTAFNAGIAPVKAAVTTSVDALASVTNDSRNTIYSVLKSLPGQAASPIPTIPPPPVASARSASPAAAAATSPAAARRAPATRTPIAAAASQPPKQTATAGAQPAGAVKAAAGTRGRAARAAD